MVIGEYVLVVIDVPKVLIVSSQLNHYHKIFGSYVPSVPEVTIVTDSLMVITIILRLLRMVWN